MKDLLCSHCSRRLEYPHQPHECQPNGVDTVREWWDLQDKIGLAMRGTSAVAASIEIREAAKALLRALDRR